MTRRILALSSAVLFLGACGGGGASDERQVLVDFSFDDFATAIFKNFPDNVEITPGQTVVFKQTWTGEPHTITGGTLVNDKLKSGSAWLDFFEGFDELLAENEDMVNPEDPGDATIADFAESLRAAEPAATSKKVLDAYRELRKAHPNLPNLDDPSDEPFEVLNTAVETASESAFEGVPFAFDEDEGNLAQNVGQPCYLRTGEPPEEAQTPCTEAQQRQPVFDGTHSFYNSGVLPYEGPRGNTFKVEFAEDTEPGSYLFYSAIHGFGQTSEITVRPTGTDVPSAGDVARRGRDEARKASQPMEEEYDTATRTGKLEVDGEEVEGPFAGIPTNVHGIVNEFVPRTIRAEANEPITWKIMGADHTISFDVPAYLPIIEFGRRFRINPKVENRAGGAPEVPEQEGEGAVEIDAGTYDGDGFWSSGLVGAEPFLAYTVRISKPGTYNYTCLIHPRMVGKVIVS